PSIAADQSRLIGKVRSVGRQSAGFGPLTLPIHCGQPVMRHQHEKLKATSYEQRTGTKQQGIDPSLNSARNSSVDLAIRTGSQELDRPPDGSSGRLHIINEGRIVLLGWIGKHSKARS